MSASPLALILTSLLIFPPALSVRAEDHPPSKEAPSTAEAAPSKTEFYLKGIGEEEQLIKSSAREMLFESKFSELDALAREYTDKKERVTGGVWKLRHFSDGLSEPGNGSWDENAWTLLITALDEWAAKSDTAFSLNVLGHAQLEYAWQVQGRAYTGRASRGRWPLFDEWVEKARGNLEKALKKDPGCVDVYRNLLRVGQSQGWGRARMDAMLQRAIKVGPEYFDNYYNMAFYLLEKWYGQPGDCQEFLNSIPALVPGDTGKEIYTRAVMQIYWNYPSESFFGDTEDKIYWRRMKKGFEVLTQKWPDTFFRNRFAFFAWQAADEDTARPLVTELKEKHRLHWPAWYNSKNLQEALKWLKLQDREPDPAATETKPERSDREAEPPAKEPDAPK